MAHIFIQSDLRKTSKYYSSIYDTKIFSIYLIINTSTEYMFV